MHRRHLLATALVVALATALAVPAHANCGAEGCPFAPLGPEAPRGMFSFDIGYQSINQDGQWLGNHSISEDQALEEEGGIGHILELETRTRSLLLVGRARISDALNLTATVPHIDRFHRHTLAHMPGHFIPAEWHFEGWGDASLVASWRAWGGANPSASAITLFAGIKLPTGEKHVEEIDGEEPEPPVRPGSGSTDGQFGLQWSRVATMHTLQGETAGIPLTVSLMTRVNGVGTDDYRMGNESTPRATAGTMSAKPTRSRIIPAARRSTPHRGCVSA